MSLPKLITKKEELKSYKTLWSNPHEEVSSRYQHVPTIELVDLFFQNNWGVYNIKESNTSITKYQGYQKHSLRFRPANDYDVVKVGDSLLEAQIVNSHNAKSSLTVSLGILEVRCTNGLVVGRASLGSITIPHRGAQTYLEALHNTFSLLESSGSVVKEIKEFKNFNISDTQALEIADTVKKTLSLPAKVESLITPVRESDNEQNLWRRMNVIQENVIRGGAITDKGKRSKGLKSIDAELKANQFIWDTVVAYYLVYGARG